MSSDKIFIVVGKTDQYPADFWMVYWSPLAEEANAAVAALEADALKFSAWKLNMQKNNSFEKYDELIEQYVEKNMNDVKYVDGTKYEIYSCSDDFRSNT